MLQVTAARPLRPASCCVADHAQAKCPASPSGAGAGHGVADAAMVSNMMLLLMMMMMMMTTMIAAKCVDI